MQSKLNVKHFLPIKNYKNRFYILPHLYFYYSKLSAMLLPKHLPSNPILSSKREFPLNFPRIDKLPPKDAKFLQVQELSFPNTAFQNLIDPDGNTSHITKTINPSKINNTLSKHTNERFLKGMLNQRNISPLEQHIGGVNDQKKNNTSFQVVSREIKKNEVFLTFFPGLIFN